MGEIIRIWYCNVCQKSNLPDRARCAHCGAERLKTTYRENTWLQQRLAQVRKDQGKSWR